MYCWRITKYNPDNRDVNGFCRKDDWTSVSDIGKKFNGVTLTFEEYLRYENAYIDAVLQVMHGNDIESLSVVALEKNGYFNFKDFPAQESKRFYNSLSLSRDLPLHSVAQITRFALREVVWCKLGCEQMYVHFGYDYYMYIGSEKPLEKELNSLINNGLFVENFISPYMA